MKVCACFLLFTIFGHIHTLTRARKRNYDPNIILQNVDNLMPEEKDNFIPNKNERRDTNTKKVKTITAFIQEAINILNNYENDDFEDFFLILNDEIRKYHYRGCKFYEIIENIETRRQLGAILELVRAKPVAETEANMSLLARILKEENYSKKVKEFVDYINSLYMQDGQEKFNKVLTALKNYGKAKYKRNTDTLVNIVKDAVRSIIFDHYTDLNPNARRELKGKIEALWKNPAQLKTTANTKFIDYTIATKGKFINTKTKVSEKEDTSRENQVSTVRGREESKSVEQQTDADSSDKESHENQHKSGAISEILDDNLTTDEKSKEVKEKDEKTDENSEEQIDDSKKDSKEATNDKETSAQSSLNSKNVDTGESIDSSSNSIEFSQERQREYNTERYVTLFPEEITYRSERLAKEAKIKQRADSKSVKKSTYQSVQRMWVEESTGGIPKYILNRYTSPTPKQPSTEESDESSDASKVWSKLKKHTKSDKKKHTQKHKHTSKKAKHTMRKHRQSKKHKHSDKKQKHTKRQKHNKHAHKKHDSKKQKSKKLKHLKLKQEKNEKHKSYKRVKVPTMKDGYNKEPYYRHRPEVVRYTQLEAYNDFKRGFDDVKTPVHMIHKVETYPRGVLGTEEFGLPIPTPAPTLSTAKYVPPRILKLKGLVRPTPSIPKSAQNMSQSRYSNQFELWDQNNVGDMRKSAAPPMISGEGVSIEEFKKERDGEMAQRKSLFNDSLSGLIDPQLINKLNNLERELDVVKAKINGSNETSDNVKGINEEANVKLVNEDFLRSNKKDGNKNFVKIYNDIVGKLQEKPTTTTTVKPTTTTVKTTTTTKKIVTNATKTTTTTVKPTTNTTTEKIDTKNKKSDPLANTVPLMALKGDKSGKSKGTTKDSKNNKTKQTTKDNKKTTKMTKGKDKGKDKTTVTSKGVTTKIVNTTVSVSTVTMKAKTANLGQPQVAKNVW
ncbi:hypothetical protein B5X24_HaOG210153 [Helicoverpa armigera]|uniref:Uncharacterized protein n=1 Tax=Helicoverpa armigera TaxID=29058 RepID=A0A2W1BH46_HELAM|nr:hypothetical protein B5X24_HaOG210153 [Helicoverpa armigera]